MPQQPRLDNIYLNQSYRRNSWDERVNLLETTTPPSNNLDFFDYFRGTKFEVSKYYG